MGSPPPILAFPANKFPCAMADDDSEKEEKKPAKTKKGSMKSDWETGGSDDVLFLPDELDIYANKVTKETYIFHGKKIDYDVIDYLEYNPDDYSVLVFRKDGSSIDLGVKIQWLVRPYFSKAEDIFIVQTKNKETVDGTSVPLIHKGQKKPKK